MVEVWLTIATGFRGTEDVSEERLVVGREDGEEVRHLGVDVAA